MLLVRTNPVPASSRRGPGGNRPASTTSTAQLATISPAATSSQVSQRGIAAAVAPPVAQRAAGVRRRLGLPTPGFPFGCVTRDISWSLPKRNYRGALRKAAMLPCSLTVD